MIVSPPSISKFLSRVGSVEAGTLVVDDDVKEKEMSQEKEKETEKETEKEKEKIRTGPKNRMPFFF